MVQQQHTVLVDLRARDQIANVLRRLGPEGQRAARELEGAGARMSRAFRSIGAAGTRLSRTLFAPFRAFGRTLRSSIIPQVLALGGALAGLQGVSNATRGFLAFEQGLAEVSTITSSSTEEIARLGEEITEVSRALGLSRVDATRGAYQAISAGFGDAADAAIVLRESAELAVAGLTDTESAVDLVTTALNAFSLEASDAARVTDVLFETVRLGKTEIPLLAQSFASAAPIAASLGVSIEEVLAAVATLTAQGTPTAEAFTQVRAALVGLLKGTEDIGAAFRAAGLEFDETTVRTQGLAKTLEQLRIVTGGSEARLVELLGRVEAVGAALVLGGTGADRFRDAVDSLRDSSGSADTALAKIQATLSNQLARTLNEIRIAFEDALGSSVALALSEVADRAGGLDRVLGQVRIVATALGEVVGVLVRRFGDFLGLLNEFIDRGGGVERIISGIRLGIDALAAGTELGLRVVRNEVQQALALIDAIPQAVDLAAAKLEKAQADLRVAVQRGAIRSLQGGNAFGFVSDEEIAKAQNFLEVLRDGAFVAERRVSILSERLSETIATIRTGTEGDNGLARLSEQYAASVDRLREFFTVAAEQVGGEFGVSLATFSASAFAAQVGVSVAQQQAAISEAVRAAAEGLNFDAGAGGGSDQALVASRQLEAFDELRRSIESDIIPTYRELEIAIATTNQERQTEIAQLFEAGDLTTEQARRLSDLANRAAEDQTALLESTRELGAFEKAANDVGRSIRDSLGDALEGVITGSLNASEAFRQFAAQVLADLARIAVQRFVLDALFPGGGAGGTGGVFGFASGGVVRGAGDFVPVRGYARGGPIVREPHVALIGEGRQNEAIVPLPDGRSIPVQLSGGSGGANVTINLSAVDGPSFRSYLVNGGADAITQAVRAGLAGADRGLMEVTRRVARG